MFEELPCCLFASFCLSFIVHVCCEDVERIILSIREEEPSLSLIGNVRDASKLGSLYSDVTFSVLRYNILSSSEYAEYFVIDSETSDLRNILRIDREAICFKKETCELKLDIGVQPREFFRVLKITVVIININDNEPVFEESIFSQDVPENSRPGSSFSLPSAYDADAGSFGISHYELLNVSSTFELSISNNYEDSKEIYLVLKERIDREDEHSYKFVVAAYDGGEAPNIGYLKIVINIQDVNDNIPYFNESSYIVNVLEDAKIGLMVTRIFALDKDSGINGIITYGFSLKTSIKFGNYFSINNETGVIRVKSKLKYHNLQNANLVITARNTAPGSKIVTTNVKMIVKDVNDNPPTITISSPPNTNQVEIKENSPIETFVAFITVKDNDIELNGEFSCYITNPDFYLIEEFNTEFTIKTNAIFDREKITVIEVNFICVDKGTPNLTSEKIIYVQVTDVNDNEPVFEEEIYSISVEEGKIFKTPVFKVQATDADSGENSEIIYSIEGHDSGILHIDSKLGDIVLKVPFDYELKQNYVFTIRAEDKGSPNLSAICQLQIKVVDIDDHLPFFLSNDYLFKIDENLPKNTFVGQVSALDYDSSYYSDFLYKLSHSQFEIDSYSGIISSTDILDRELISIYYLDVYAVNTFDAKMRNSTRVTVKVNDVNDEIPFMIFPNETNHTLRISKQAKAGSLIGKIIAHDYDIGINAELKFYCKNLLDQNLVVVEEKTGIMRIQHDLEELNFDNFTVTITVKDSGLHHHEVETYFLIYIDENLPTSAEIKNNLTIVIGVIGIAFVLTAVLILAIALTRQEYNKRKKMKYISNPALNISKFVRGETMRASNISNVSSTTCSKGVTAQRSHPDASSDEETSKAFGYKCDDYNYLQMNYQHNGLFDGDKNYRNKQELINSYLYSVPDKTRRPLYENHFDHTKYKQFYKNDSRDQMDSSSTRSADTTNTESGNSSNAETVIMKNPPKKENNTNQNIKDIYADELRQALNTKRNRLIGNKSESIKNINDLNKMNITNEEQPPRPPAPVLTKRFHKARAESPASNSVNSSCDEIQLNKLKRDNNESLSNGNFHQPKKYHFDNGSNESEITQTTDKFYIHQNSSNV